MTRPNSPDLERNLKHFDDCMNLAGYFVLPSVLSTDEVNALRAGMAMAYSVERPLQKAAGIGEQTVGTVHHLPAISKVFVDYLETTPARPYIDRYFGGKPYVLNSMGGNFNLPGSPHYASNIHRDQRSCSHGWRLMLNTFVALDDTTRENGATWLSWGTHKREDKPTDEAFYKRANQIEVSAGSILMWNSDVWHCAGENRTDKQRRILTPIYSRPFVKPGFAYDKAVSPDGLTDYQAQVLGFNARIPETLTDWYSKDRAYKQGQG